MPKLVLMPYLYCVGNLCRHIEPPFRTKSMFTLMSQKSLSKRLEDVSPHTLDMLTFHCICTHVVYTHLCLRASMTCVYIHLCICICWHVLVCVHRHLFGACTYVHLHSSVYKRFNKTVSCRCI